LKQTLFSHLLKWEETRPPKTTLKNLEQERHLTQLGGLDRELSKTRVFFVSDLHGSDKLFLKFVNAGKIYKTNVLIVGGDVLGKVITPIFNNGGTFFATVQGNRRNARSNDEIETLKKDIRFLGNYPYVTSEKEWSELLNNQAKMDQVFERLANESVKRWCEIGEQRLASTGIRLIINKGNDDSPVLEETLRESTFVEYPNEKVVLVDDKHEMISLGYSNITPWHLVGDIPEDVLETKLTALASQVKNMENCIFNTHVPPYDTHLDIAPKLDENLTPKLSPGGEPEMAHVGSTAVRNAIERFQPLIGLHGHIHESKGFTKIGRTDCFNPGSEYSSGILKGVVLDLSDKKLESHLFTSA
jgi:Icc-related predicted phosphoesterase